MCSRSSSRRRSVKRRILIVDDHPLVRRGLTELINGEPDLVVCGEAATERSGIDAVARLRPDLVIADLSLGQGDGLSMVARIRADTPGLPILVLSMHDAPAYVDKAFHLGANGYASKQEIGKTLLAGIRCVLAGQLYASPKTSGGPDGR